MTLEALLPRLKDDKVNLENFGNGEDLELLPIYVNPESEIRRIKEDDLKYLKDLKRVITTLTRFDLSDREVKVYLFLARFGPQKALTITKSLDIHRTEVYKILDNLESQGLISRILERPLRFMALPLRKVLNNFIEDRRRLVKELETNRDELLEIWSNLPHRGRIEVKEQTYQVLESRKQVWMKIKEIAERCEEQFDMVINERDVIWLYKTPLFEELEDEIAERGLDVSLLTNYSRRRSYLPEGIMLEGAKICHVDTLNFPSFFITDDSEIVLILDNGCTELSAMWTNYESIAQSYRVLYNLFSNQIDESEFRR
ncbi:MAG: TrmB family transcriptional regulator [Candidatus Bathyarchaeia archaeon]